MIQPIDQSIRERVIQEVDRTLSVFAGAGTGKTTLLTQRYLSLLSQKKVSPKQIVAITFTIKAASELRERILHGLQEKNLQHLTAAVETSPIGTIHSFCSNLLRQFALETNLDPQFVVISELEHRTFLMEIFQTWFTKTLADHVSTFKTLRAVGITVDQIRKLALKLYEYRDLLDRLSVRTEEISANTFSEILSEVRALHQFAMQACEDQEDKGFTFIHHLRRSLEQIDNTPKDSRSSLIINEKLLKSAPGTQGNWNSAKDCKEFKSRYEAIRLQLENLQRSYAQHLFSSLLNWAKTYVDHVKVEKQNRSVLDFADLLTLTRDLIRDNASVREQIQQQFEYYLIDEFQDTDPIQAEIFWTLARDEKKHNSQKPWYEQTLIPGKLFTVGDFNQSIYRFRDASIETYKQATDTIQAQGELLYILHNFRSHNSIIETVNEFFTQVLPEEFKPLLTHKTSETEPAIHMLAIPTQDLKDESRSMEADSIASHIRHLVDSKRQIKDPIRKIERPLTYKDVALLFPALTSLSVYERAFRKQSIPFVVYKGGAFFDTPEIHSIIVTLYALLYPFDTLGVPSALSSEWLGCSLDDLMLIKKQFDTFDYRKMDLSNVRDPVRHPIEILQTLHKNILTTSPVQFVHSFLTHTQAFAHAEFRVNTVQVKENLKKLTWLAHEFEANQSQNINEFYQWISHLADQPDPSKKTPEAIPDQANAVQFMTIHTSKGLEFPVVFLANFVSKIQEGASLFANRFDQKLEVRMGDKDTLFKTDGFDELAEREKKLFLEEKNRLMYVAMTRAREVLVVPSSSEEATGYQKLLEPLKSQSDKFKAFDYSQTKPDNKITSKTEPSMSIKIDTAFLAQIPKGYVRTTATEEKEEVVAHTPTKPYAFIQRPKVGIAFHAYVEQSTKHELQSDLLNQIVIEHGIENQKADLEKLIITYLNSDLYHRIRKADNTLKEVPFSYFKDGILYEGYIDLVLKEGDQYTIIDLKTDQITESQLAERSKLYASQLSIYETALKQAGMKVKDKILYFVRLDKVKILSI